MPADRDALIGAADDALKAGDWSTARTLYEAAVALEETPEALLGLGTALWWLQEADASLRCRERAYAAFRRRSDPFKAAIVALQLCPHYSGSLGNYAAARGWLGRAARLVEEFKLAQLDGWVLLGRAALATTNGDPPTGEVFAREALDFARRFPDPDLELCALSQLGGALVMMGRIEGRDRTARRGHGRRARRRGRSRDGGPRELCDRRQLQPRGRGQARRSMDPSRAMTSIGVTVRRTSMRSVARRTARYCWRPARWAEAEAELQGALEKMSPRAEPLIRTEALATFAELRLGQGRIEEAARLLEGIEDHVACVKARASLGLARGELVVAASILRRRLRDIGETLESASLAGAADRGRNRAGRDRGGNRAVRGSSLYWAQP